MIFSRKLLKFEKDFKNILKIKHVLKRFIEPRFKTLLLEDGPAHFNLLF